MHTVLGVLHLLQTFSSLALGPTSSLQKILGNPTTLFILGCSMILLVPMAELEPTKHLLPSVNCNQISIKPRNRTKTGFFSPENCAGKEAAMQTAIAGEA